MSSCLNSVRCCSCRPSILGLFIRSYAPPLRTGIRGDGRTQPRVLSRCSSFQPTGARQKGAPAPAVTESVPNGNGASTSEPGPKSTEAPWYLQVETPRHPALHFEPPPLPDIPENSPRLMEPLVKFVSDDLGLDALSLLDLRSLHPPPALGPKLLMLFGTARSERHLHISADRLVRWLRTRGVSAQADGLLGRNELKTRLRRRARKAKLLGSTGSIKNADDGISTGWVCVNLGTIGWSDAEIEIMGDDGRLSGFGVPQTGTTIVVQLLTASRRTELDLETLWTRALERSEAKAIREDSSGLSLAGESNTGTQPRHQGGTRSLRTSTQRRSFSSVARRTTPEIENVSLLVRQFRKPHLDPAEVAEISEISRTNADDKHFTLAQSKENLTKLPRPDAIKGLLRRGAGIRLDISPTSRNEPSDFLRLFDKAMENLPLADTWRYRLWLPVMARILGHPEYHLAELGQLVEEMELSGIEASRDQYLDLIRAIFATKHTIEPTVLEKSKLAMRVINIMSERGHQVLAQDVIVTVIESLVQSAARGQDAKELQSRSIRRTRELGEILAGLAYSPRVPGRPVCQDVRLPLSSNGRYQT